MNPDLRQKIIKIRLIVSDVDGTLTDGRIFINADGNEAKCYSAHDGLAANVWVKLGNKFALLTGRAESETVKRRAREMKCADVVFSSSDKDADLRSICSRLGVNLDETLYLGDDLPDISAMRVCSLAASVANAAPEVKQMSQIVLSANGGMGALRELIELLLKTQGRWDDALAFYMS